MCIRDRDTDKTFTMNKDFDAAKYFEGCCGVITSDEPLQRIVVRAYDNFVDYLWMIRRCAV